MLANKQDIEGAANEEDIKSIMEKTINAELLNKQTIKIFKTAVTTGEGLEQAMDWLADVLHKKQ